MPKKKKVSDKQYEIEIFRSHFSLLVSQFNYMDVKKQFVTGPVVKLSKCDGRSTRVEGCWNGESSVFLSPQQTPERPTALDCSPETPQPSMHTTDYSLNWLDKFDDVTQLLVASLLTQQYVLFACLLGSRNEIQSNHLLIITEVLEKFPCSELRKCLMTTLENEPTAKVKNYVASIIIELMMTEMIDSEKMTSKCLVLMGLANKYEIKLLKKMNILNSRVGELPVCLLVIEFLLIKENVEDVVNILCHNKIISKFLSKGCDVTSDYFWMYTLTVINTFRKMYKMNKSAAALQLALFIIASHAMPFGSETWGSLALLTLLDDHSSDAADITKLFKQLFVYEVAIPLDIQRLVLIELHKRNREEAQKIFVLAPVYSQLRIALPTMEPLPKKLTILIMDSWTEEEMEVAVMCLNNQIKAKVSRSDIHCSVKIKRGRSNDEDVTIDDGSEGLNVCISKRLRRGDPPRERLSRVIGHLNLQLALTFD